MKQRLSTLIVFSTFVCFFNLTSVFFFFLTFPFYFYFLKGYCASSDPIQTLHAKLALLELLNTKQLELHSLVAGMNQSKGHNNTLQATSNGASEEVFYCQRTFLFVNECSLKHAFPLPFLYFILHEDIRIYRHDRRRAAEGETDYGSEGSAVKARREAETRETDKKSPRGRACKLSVKLLVYLLFRIMSLIRPRVVADAYYQTASNERHLIAIVGA